MEGAEGEVQLLEFLLSVHRVQFPAPHELDVVVCTCNPSTLEMEAGR